MLLILLGLGTGAFIRCSTTHGRGWRRTPAACRTGSCSLCSGALASSRLSSRWNASPPSRVCFRSTRSGSPCARRSLRHQPLDTVRGAGHQARRGRKRCLDPLRRGLGGSHRRDTRRALGAARGAYNVGVTLRRSRSRPGSRHTQNAPPWRSRSRRHERHDVARGASHRRGQGAVSPANGSCASTSQPATAWSRSSGGTIWCSHHISAPFRDPSITSDQSVWPPVRGDHGLEPRQDRPRRPQGRGQSLRHQPRGFTIHSAIHAARADAKCVLHVHSLNGVAVSAQKSGLLPLSQQATFICLRSPTDYEGIALLRMRAAARARSRRS